MTVVFYVGGSETGSSPLPISPGQTIAPGQSLTFAAVGVSDDGNWTSDAYNFIQANVPPGVTSCTVANIGASPGT